jgi:uncharacterized protein YoxC
MIVLFLLIFAILAFFIIQTLLKLQTTLQNTNRLMAELQFKMEKVDPLLNSLSNAGEIFENKTEKWKQNYFDAQQLASKDSDFYDWTLLTVSLLKNYLRRGENG